MAITTARLKKSAIAVAVAAAAIGGLTALPAHAASSLGGSITRSEVIARAQNWFNQNVPYDQNGSFPDGTGTNYRPDCGGFVDMAWHASSQPNTSGLDSRSITSRVALGDLLPGDALDDSADGHAILFDHWVNQSTGEFSYYQEANSTDDMMHNTDFVNGGSDGMIAGHPASNYFGLRYNNIVDDLTLNYSQTTAGDYNGDKISDLFAKDASGNLSVWTGNTGGTFSARHQLTGGWNVTQTTAADFTSHGLADLIGSDSSGNLSLWTANSGGVYSAPKVLTTGWNFTQMVSGDFRGTGHQDLIAKDSSNNLYLWAGNGAGAFASKALLTGGWNYTQTTAGDFNDDGITDLVAKDSNNNLYLWTGNKGGTFSAAKLLTSGWNYTQTVAGNFAGTGHTDLIARDDTTGTLYRWSGNGNGTFNSKVTVTTGW